MSEQLFVAIILVVSWGSLPLSMIYANKVFDNDVVRAGEEAGHH